MQPEQLVNLVQRPRNIDKAAIQELRKVLYQYPYFQVAYTLIAKGIYDQDPQKAQQAIQIAAVYAPDRNHLKLLLEDKLGYAKLAEVNEGQQVADELPGTSNPMNQPVQETQQMEFINSYITNIYAKQTKEVTNKKSLAQLNIIDNFIKQGGKFRAVTIKGMSLEDMPTDLTKDNADFHDDLLTENLARVMIKQGNFERAIDIYKRLQRKFPEKGAYFSTLSEEIKKDI
jgi:tetratricopeptide (TPR) repeat protein